jgi:MoaA/NifB/PqqE/SkfB family radical SAM enzyme
MKYYKKYRDFLFGKVTGQIRWGYVIFFATYRCNAKCRHCFYWKNLNKKDDMSLEEIDKITKKLGLVQVLLLSGGEPLLRNDIVEVISLFVMQNRTKVVSIPTNAILPDLIAEKIKRLAENHPEVTFSVNPSIDRLFEKNDEMRGVNRAFEKSVETLREIEKLRQKYNNIELVVNTTVSELNYREIDDIIDYFKQFDLTYHNFELLRGSPKEQDLSLPSLDKIKDVHAKVLKARNYYIDRDRLGYLEKLSVLGIINYTQSLKEKVLDSGRFPFICSAGKNIIVIEPNGNVRLCELLPPVGNLKDYDYDIELLLKNDATERLWNQIKTCKCTHVCFINMSIAHDKKTLLKIPYYFLKWKSQRSA